MKIWHDTDYGTYVETCVICYQQYVGQKENKFSKRWLARRVTWSKPDEDNND